jgi:uncharacterized protein YidB (DUF937 family)
MSLFENLANTLKGALGQGGAAEAGVAIMSMLAQSGGLQAIVSKLEAGGLGDQVKSWLGPGANLPVTADQLRAALGNEQVQQMARQMGLPVDQVLSLLATHVPTMVDHASPNGTLTTS